MGSGGWSLRRAAGVSYSSSISVARPKNYYDDKVLTLDQPDASRVEKSAPDQGIGVVVYVVRIGFLVHDD